ncbi:hypothetical protein E4U42_000947 [Claviceps africana]|uniref:Uncharacterized protein n=1 Tax=Claviceps africana TaxID=83212 RepID=A0A8K0NI90_9HYPO|nr:hypothetical protein E4U42_000947 [Claviceps africana]
MSSRRKCAGVVEKGPGYRSDTCTVGGTVEGTAGERRWGTPPGNAAGENRWGKPARGTAGKPLEGRTDGREVVAASVAEATSTEERKSWADGD